jgi:hypothetical protein
MSYHLSMSLIAHAVFGFAAGWWLRGAYDRWRDRRKPAPF